MFCARFICGGIMAALCLLSIGCAAHGPAFSPTALKPPADKCVVYVYRSGSMVGSAIRGNIYVGSQGLGFIGPGEYLTAVCDPGAVTVTATTENTNELKMTLKPGESAYVRAQVSMGLVIARLQLTQYPQAEAEKDISECKWANPPAVAKP